MINILSIFIFSVFASFLFECSLPVSVRNTPDRPIPTAPMAREVPQDDGTTLVNPQLGGAPTADLYDEAGFDWGSLLLAASTGNWIGVAGAAIAALGVGAAAKQRTTHKKHVHNLCEERDRLARSDPVAAEAELLVIKSKERQA